MTTNRREFFGACTLAAGSVGVGGVAGSFGAGGCATASEPRRSDSSWPQHEATSRPPIARASGAFRGLWFDGNAELSGYRLTVPRYGELRTAEMALTYVTEPMNRQTRIKDDDAAAPDRIDVLKLNVNLGFLTGIYPYSVMTSVFSPIDSWGGSMHRFAPVKISLTAQEWCGHAFHAVWPGRDAVVEQLASYFASEGDTVRRVATPEGTVYEDALLIQLRELDGPFADGGSWEGALVPSLWRFRRAHIPLAPTAATISRESAQADGTPITRFVLQTEGYRRTYEVESQGARRVLGWTTSDGEQARILKTARLPYWKLNHSGEEHYRGQLGLPVDLRSAPDAAPPGTVSIGK